MSLSPSRRRALLAVAAALSGCGFELRRTPSLPFRTIHLAGFKPGSPLAAELRRGIEASETTHVVESPLAADVVLEALADAREQSVAASTAAGQVRELQLRARLSFRLRTPAGKVLIPLTEIVQSRELSYSESAALAKEQEAAQLYRAMQSDIAQQVMRRLAAAPAA